MTLRNVLITGSNRGIGLELCKQLSQLDTTEHIIATTRSPQNSKELNELSKSNPKLRVLRLDTRDYRHYDQLLDVCHLIVRNKGINLLINNAGVMMRDTLTSVTPTSLMDAFNTNAIAPLMLTKKLLPLLKSSAQNKQLAAVVNISSVLGSITVKLDSTQNQWYPYRISKASLNMVTKLLAFDLAEHNILAVGIHPGWVKTDMGTKNALLEPQFAVKEIMKILQNINKDINGRLVNYNGMIII